MKSALLRFYRAAQCLKISKCPATLARLSRFPKLDLSIFAADTSPSRILIKGTQVDATAPGREFLLQGSEQVARLLREAKAAFSPLPDGVLLEVGGVKLKIQTWEELFIATEVFCEGVYNVSIGGPFVLIDIGMNVGTTSLFFARQAGCRAVCAYELFPKTAARARANFALNPDIAGKIETTVKGLAAKTSSDELDYNEEFKGSIGREGLPDYSHSCKVQYEKVRVEFICSAEVFAAIGKKHAGMKLVCKVDCEGAEYEILETLDGAGLVPQVDCFMIEWHKRGPRPIETLLQKNGFAHLSVDPTAPHHGMIYAWRTADPAFRPLG